MIETPYCRKERASDRRPVREAGIKIRFTFRELKHIEHALSMLIATKPDYYKDERATLERIRYARQFER